MKVLLINPPIRGTEPPRHPPFGLATIAQVLLDEKHQVEIWDINAERPSEKEVVQQIKKLDNYATLKIINVKWKDGNIMNQY